MNRIKISPLATAKKAVLAAETDFPWPKLQRHLSIGGKGEFSLFLPVHYQSSYAYPLIVWLHQDGADCGEVVELMPKVSQRNYIAVSPQSSFGGMSPVSWPNCEESIEAAYQSVMASVDSASSRFNINSDRIYLAGAGTGGTMALNIAFQRPDVFAGVVSIDGPMNPDEVPLHDWERCRDLNVLLSSFRNSLSFCEDDLCHSLRLLHVAGFSTTVRQYPGELRLDEKVLSDMNRWIMEQIGSAIL